MSVWWQNGRRSRYSPGKLLGHILDMRYGAAEGVLGAVAVVLIVWMLWPEASGPQLDQRETWQQSLEEAERRRVSLEAERGQKIKSEARQATSETSTKGDRPSGIAERPSELDRPRIARPSELADRLGGSEQLAAARSFQPAPKRPSRSVDPAIDADILLRAETTTDRDQNEADASSGAGQAVEIAALSNEAPVVEPLPEIDLSDLDILVPEETIETASVPPVDPVLPDVAVLTPSPDATIAPLIVEPELADLATDVQERPRDDAPTWLKNAVTAAVDDDRPIIAVVIDDLGLNRPNTAKLNDLPSPLTLAFLPYAGRIEEQTDAAQAAGHELMLHLPMEPIGSDWPGPDALTTKLDQEEFVTRLEKNLDRFGGFVGINNHMGSKLTADSSRMDVVMRELRRRDVLFLDSKTSARSVAVEFAGRNGVPNTTRDVFLDHVIDLGAIKRQLVLTEKIARRSGSAVAIGHPHAPTIQALREWLPSLEARGFVLAPISAVVARRACGSGILIAPQTCGRYLQARTPSESELAAKDG